VLKIIKPIQGGIINDFQSLEKGQPKWAPNLEFTKFEFSVKF